VAESVPGTENEETLSKARGLLRALEMAETQL
jgi:anthranilate/para-aminobenzoate synthase component I